VVAYGFKSYGKADKLNGTAIALLITNMKSLLEKLSWLTKILDLLPCV